MLERSQVSANEKVQLVSLCYKDAPLQTGEPGQLLQPGIYAAKELPNGAFATGLVRKIEQPKEDAPKAAAKAKTESKPSTEGEKS